MTFAHPPSWTAEFRATLRLGLPLVAGQLAAFGGNLVEVLLAGHLGAETLGAVALATSIWSVPLMAIIGLMMAVAPSVAQLDGARRRGEVAGMFRQAVWLGLLLGLLVMAALLLGARPLTRLIGLAPDLAGDVVLFLYGVSWGAPGLALFCACRGVADGLSHPRVTLAFSLLGLAVLLPVAYALMYGRWGVPVALGAQGSGIAAAIMCWVEAVAFFAYLRLARMFVGIGWGQGPRRPHLAAMLGLLRLGGPMAVSVVLEVGLFSGAALLIGGFGAVAVASHQVALNVASFTFMVPLGLATAVTVRVGNAVGRGDLAGIRRAGLAGIALALMAQGVSCAAMLCLPHAIAGLYSTDPGVVGGAAALLFYAAIFQLSDGLQVSAAGALRGLKDTSVPMLITAFSYWGVGMPVGWYLAMRAGYAVPGMWMGLIAGLSFAALLLFTRFLRLSKTMPPRQIPA